MLRGIIRKFYYRSIIQASLQRYAYLREFDPQVAFTQSLQRKEHYTIAFLIPGLPAFGGGITSILRLGTYLSELGHDVSYISCSAEEVVQMEKNAISNLKNYKGKIVRLSSLTTQRFDVGIATLWDTAYHLRIKDLNFGYKAYFIQDFETLFYPKGDLFHLCKNTYFFGFHMISLGAWNAEQIKKQTPDATVDSIIFPIELAQYPLHKKTIAIKKSVRLAVYFKFESKRATDLIMQSLLLLHDGLKSRDISLECLIYGTDISLGFPFARTLGMLNHKELRQLYETSDFGLVASFTNISLVPFEMAASGLPVLDYKDGSAPFFFSQEEMVFLDIYPVDLVRKVLYYISNQQELQNIVQRAQEAIVGKTWKQAAAEFDTILRKAAK